ncbi:type I DNA topoisomerase [uncultured Bartonella sp.]|uniref:type I DNA topoisomerase n=1 Tax=uncultured Bartonella sp. TaxID=104108 RepID=UPI0025D887C6|nr:type I DNA topoisomerase [uncultured Bartonella sp.]
MDVVVVESPAKAKTINKYLGPNYKVLASFGHVRDLPAKDGSVLPDEDFAMKWDTSSTGAKRIAEISKALKDADGLILATDPDREGEAISWHVLDILQHKKLLKGKPVKRVVFNAITKHAVLDAMAHPRDIDIPLVDAYMARRALDYLVGFTLSPVLWRKLPGARSAGRVQSVALRLICDRESEIERFKREDYWSIEAKLATKANESFLANLTTFNRKKLAKLDIKTEDQAKNIRNMLDGAGYRITSVESKPTKRNPVPPFTTSTLQQAASSKLGFSASRTMQVAQKLYEGIDIGGETTGLITYMRTDGVQIAPEAIEAARNAIHDTFGANYVPEKPRFYSTKAKNAQEAHEAIRPTDFKRKPDDIKKFLDSDQFKLYELVWKRAIASQMKSADIERTTDEIEAINGSDHANLRAVGSVITFDGFIAAYFDQKDDDSADSEDSMRLPKMEADEELKKVSIDALKHTTEPPARYSEATLIKKLEELGIGRPSTYASTLATLRDRDYVTIDKRRLIPEAKGRIVTAFLENFFNRYVEYDFTADLEEKLDLISDGKLSWKQVLREFWDAFNASVSDIKELRVSNVLDVLNDALAPLAFPPREDGSDPRSCPLCHEGRLSLKLGRYGAFVGCSNYPDCKYTRQLGSEDAKDSNATEKDGPTILGKTPDNGEDVILKIGRFGPYVECKHGDELKRAGLPKSWSPSEMNLEKALALLSLPREVGIHPETGKPIMASIGRYGPYVSHDGQYANLETPEEVFDIGINRAVSVLAEKQARGGARRGSTPKAIATLGQHPDGGDVTVRDGRYGPYVNWGKINATLPKGKDPASVTLEEALELISQKAASPKKGRKATVKKSATKTTATKKSVTKKTVKKASTKKATSKKAE